MARTVDPGYSRYPDVCGSGGKDSSDTQEEGYRSGESERPRRQV